MGLTTDLRRHDDEGPPPDWRVRYVSAYATMHPWEDWAETFAHYLHIRDTPRTAAGPPVGRDRDPAAADAPRGGTAGEPAGTSLAEIVAQWLPLTYALNAVNRSMGRDDLDPFVLTATVQHKLAFVPDVIAAGQGDVQGEGRPDGAGAGLSAARA